MATVTRMLVLTRDEIMVCTDRVQNTDCGTDEKPIQVYGLLLKLGSAYLEAMTLDGKVGPEVPVAVTEAEAWLLRGKVTSGDKTSSDQLFGVKLLRKIYEVLERYNDGLGDLCTTEEGGDPMTADERQVLREWHQKEAGDA